MYIELKHVNYSYGCYYLLGRIQINVNFNYKCAFFEKQIYLPVMKLAPLDLAHI